jgi:hypothetical protein
MTKNRKHRQCPHCKSKKGFVYMVILGGYHQFEMTFNGKIITNERHGTDNVDKYAQCLSCKKLIDIDYLQTDLHD